MSDRKAGDTVGYIPRVMQKRFLDYNLRKGAAWRQIKTLAEEELKLFYEIDRVFDLGDWVYSVDAVLGKIILERHKTMQEQELIEAQRVLIENAVGEVAK
jgi:hypothetical protein